MRQCWTLTVPCISETCIEIKIKLNFYFRTSFEAPQRSATIKIYLIFSLRPGLEWEVFKESDSKGNDFKLESPIKPGELYMNTNSMLFNKNNSKSGDKISLC